MVAQVAPLGSECLFNINKYCARGVEVVRLLEEGDMPCLATAIAAAGANPGVDNDLAVRWASRNGHIEAVRLLLADPRVDPCARRMQQLCYRVGLAIRLRRSGAAAPCRPPREPERREQRERLPRSPKVARTMRTNDLNLEFPPEIIAAENY